MSHSWEQFENDFLSANSWAQRKDGFPADLLEALSADERVRAVEILRTRLDGRDDWPIRAMAHLGIAESVPRLRELLCICQAPIMQAVIATSIYELTKDSSMESIVTTVATARDREWVHRLDAIHCLGRFKTDTAAKVLSKLTEDPNYLVSYNARIAGGKPK
jgi:HEAT repeat protein